tara:strand:+ start:94 stop:516 length:423 start_codon:yes stop_codon:yes gene_type:complete
MNVYSDDINKGYEIIKRHLEDVGLANRIYNIQIIDPLLIHNTFADHYGGLCFGLDIRSVQSSWEIVYTYKDLFDIIAHTEKTEEIFLDFNFSDLMSILFALVDGIKIEEENVLKHGLNETEYRKVAKRMHYNEKYGDPLF